MSSLFAESGGGLFGGGSRRSQGAGGSRRRRRMTPQQLAALQAAVAAVQLGQPRDSDKGDIDYSWKKAFGVTDIGGRALGQIGEALIYTPVGLYEMGKAASHDTAALMGRLPFAGRYAREAAQDSFQSDDLATAIAKGYYEDFRHPLRNPGYLAMDLFGLASLGAGSVARGSAALKATQEMRATRRSARRGEPPPDLGAPPAAPGPRPSQPPAGARAMLPPEQKSLFNMDALVHPGQMSLEDAMAAMGPTTGPRVVKRDPNMQPDPLPPSAEDRFIDSIEGIDIKDEQLRAIYERADYWRDPAKPDFKVKATPDRISLQGTPFYAVRRDRELYKPEIRTGKVERTPEQLAGGDIPGAQRSAIEQANEHRMLTGSVARIQKALRDAEEKAEYKSTIQELLRAADELEKQAAQHDKFAGYTRTSYKAKKTSVRAGWTSGLEGQPMGERVGEAASASQRLRETRIRAKELRDRAQAHRTLAEDLQAGAQGADRTAIKAIEKRLTGAVEKLQKAGDRRSVTQQRLGGMVGQAGAHVPDVKKVTKDRPESRPVWQLFMGRDPISGDRYIDTSPEGTKSLKEAGGRIFVTGNTPSEAADNAMRQLARVEAEHQFLKGYKKAKHKDTFSLVYGGADVREAMVRRADTTRKINQFEKRRGDQEKRAEKLSTEQAGVQALLRKIEETKQGVDPDDPRAAALADLASMRAQGKVSAKTQEKVEKDLQPSAEKRLLREAEQAATPAEFLDAFEKWQAKYGQQVFSGEPAAPTAARPLSPVEAASPLPPVRSAPEAAASPPEPAIPPTAPAPVVRTGELSSDDIARLPEDDRWRAVDARLEATELLPKLITGRVDEYRGLFQQGYTLVDRDGKVINESVMDQMIDREVARQRKLDPSSRVNDPEGREGLLRDRAEYEVEWRLFGIEKMNYARRRGIFFGEAPKREDIKALFGDVVEQTPREKGTNPRNLGDAPRATGDSLRQRKLSKRDLGVSSKQLKAAGLEGDLKSKADLLHKEIRPLYERAGQPPTMGELYTAMSRILGEEDAKRVLGPRGGADVPSLGQIMRAFAREFAKRPQPGTMKIGYDRTVIQKQEKLDPERLGEYYDDPSLPGRKLPFTIFEDVEKVERVEANMPLSRNPLVRRFQIWQYHQMEQHPESRVGPFGRSLSKAVEKERQQYKKIVDRIKELGLLEKTDELEARAFNAQQRHLKPVDMLDTANELVKILTLYAKPAYLTLNMLGQLLIATAHHNLNPISMARTSKLQHELRGLAKSDAEWAQIDATIRSVMGEGMLASFGHGINAIELKGDTTRQKLASAAKNPPRAMVVGTRNLGDTIQQGFGKIPGFQKILDTPFRWNAFLHEAHMKGYSDAEQIKQLVLNEDFRDDLVEVAQRANKAAIDYTRMGRAEKEIVRRIIFFYPWVKGATVYAGHFAAEHPAQLMAQVGAARVGQERAEEKLGKVPSYAEGLIPAGSREVPGLGEVPTVINPAAFSVLGTPGDVLGLARAFGVGGRRESEAVSEFLNPIASGLVGWGLGVDPFTGRSYPRDMSGFDIIAQEASQAGAPFRLADQIERAEAIESGELDPTEVLYPRSKQEAIFNWATGAYPFAINPKEATARGYAEEQSLKSKEQRELDQADFDIKRYEEAFAKIDRPMPNDLRRALEMGAKRSANLAVLEKELGGELSQLDRLRSDLDLIVREGMMDEQQAKQLLLAAVRADDESLETYRERLAARYFGRKLVTGWRRNFSRIGVELPSG